VYAMTISRDGTAPTVMRHRAPAARQVSHTTPKVLCLHPMIVPIVGRTWIAQAHLAQVHVRNLDARAVDLLEDRVTPPTTCPRQAARRATGKEHAHSLPAPA
jgi:anti-sigma factor RsiW